MKRLLITLLAPALLCVSLGCGSSDSGATSGGAAPGGPGPANAPNAVGAVRKPGAGEVHNKAPALPKPPPPPR